MREGSRDDRIRTPVGFGPAKVAMCVQYVAGDLEQEAKCAKLDVRDRSMLKETLESGDHVGG